MFLHHTRSQAARSFHILNATFSFFIFPHSAPISSNVTRREQGARKKDTSSFEEEEEEEEEEGR